jgi:hypothetical protein
MNQFIEDHQLAEKLNGLRAAKGMAPLSQGEVQALIRDFDETAAPSTMGALRLPGGRLRQALSLMSPSRLRDWLDPSRGGTIENGRLVALGRLGVDVMVTGHTHNAKHHSLVVDGTTKHMLDSGTWASWYRSSAKMQQSKLTFVSVQFAGGQAKPQLCQWIPGRNLVVACPAIHRER